MRAAWQEFLGLCADNEWYAFCVASWVLFDAYLCIFPPTW